MPLSTFAASSNPYKDVTKKAVGKNAYNAIKYVKSHSGYKGISIKKKCFKPNKTMTRREFIVMLANFYGKKNVPVSVDDVLGALKPATPKWATAKMVAVAKRKNKAISWDDKSTKKMSRALASQYLEVFAKFDKVLAPCQ